ncbi:MAG: DUF4145 domain-containing protein [Beijerinckiaceae bacterium]|jgi:hypothetical protein
MPQLQLDCPFCFSERAAFTSRAGVRTANGAALFMQCGVCQSAVILDAHHADALDWALSHSPNVPTYFNVWPQKIKLKSPDHSPQNVSGYFMQGIDSLARKNLDAAGVMFRKALDAGLKKLHPEGKGSLEKRIDSLPVETGVTPAMKAWAHSIRRLGNDAAHEEEPFSEEEAKDLKSFTELFLTYAFTLPGMLAERAPAEVVSAIE